MTTINCKDVTGEDCNHSISANTALEARKKMSEHVESAHPEIGDEGRTEMDQKISAMY